MRREAVRCEFEGLAPVDCGVERVGLGVGAGHELDVAVVERVDQGDEALGGVAILEST